MSLDAIDAERFAPLAALSSACDEMEIMLDPARKWYPEVEQLLRQLDYAIRWEMDRLQWEVEFMKRVQEVERESSRKARGKRVKRVSPSIREAADSAELTDIGGGP